MVSVSLASGGVLISQPLRFPSMPRAIASSATAHEASRQRAAAAASACSRLSRGSGWRRGPFQPWSRVGSLRRGRHPGAWAARTSPGSRRWRSSCSWTAQAPVAIGLSVRTAQIPPRGSTASPRGPRVSTVGPRCRILYGNHTGTEFQSETLPAVEWSGAASVTSVQKRPQTQRIRQNPRSDDTPSK